MSQQRKVLDEVVSVQHHRLAPSKDENVHARNSMRPDFGPLMAEKSKELGNEDIERSIEGIRVEYLSRVLANLLQCSKRSFTFSKVSAVQLRAERGQEFRPVEDGSPACNSGDQDADSCPDQGGGVSNCLETSFLEVDRHIRRELVEVRLHIVLEDETGQGAGCHSFSFLLGQHVQQVAVEIRELDKN